MTIGFDMGLIMQQIFEFVMGMPYDQAAADLFAYRSCGVALLYKCLKGRKFLDRTWFCPYSENPNARKTVVRSGWCLPYLNAVDDSFENAGTKSATAWTWSEPKRAGQEQDR